MVIWATIDLRRELLFRLVHISYSRQVSAAIQYLKFCTLFIILCRPDAHKPTSPPYEQYLFIGSPTRTSIKCSYYSELDWIEWGDKRIVKIKNSFRNATPHSSVWKAHTGVLNCISQGPIMPRPRLVLTHCEAFVAWRLAEL